MGTKSYSKKKQALLLKGNVTNSMWLAAYDKDMSEMHADQRYWILVFAKSPGYKFKHGERIMPTTIKVWDTEEEKWVNTILQPHYMNGASSSVYIDYKHHLIMFSLKGQNDLHRVYIYSFFNNNPLANPLVARAKDTTEVIQWRIVNDEFLIFNDEMNWHSYNLADLQNRKGRHYEYTRVKVVGENEMEIFFGIEDIVQLHIKLTVFFIRPTFHKDTYTAVVYTSTQKDPVYLTPVFYLPVTTTRNLSEQTSLKDNVLTIGNNSLDVAIFI